MTIIVISDKKKDEGGEADKQGKEASGKFVALPIRLCEPHPDLQTRLRYDQIDRLAEDIRVNGQLQPGRAVEKEDGTGYRVYLGIGRLLAIRKLFEQHGEPRSYFALLDEGLPFIELFLRSMSENLKREDLSVLEEARSYYLASRLADEDELIEAAARLGEGAAAVKRKITVARTFGEKLERLYEIERRAGFSFQLSHLEVFAEISDERTLYETAAVTASSRFNAKEARDSLRQHSPGRLIGGVPWFGELFPQYASPSGAQEEGGDGAGNGDDDHGNGATRAASSSSPDGQSRGGRGKAGDSHAGTHPPPPASVTYKERLSFAECPYCGAQNPFELKEKAELTSYRFEGGAVPRKDSVSPDGVYRRRCDCVNPGCGEEFWLLVSSIDGATRAEAGKQDEFKVPGAEPRVGSIGWSSEVQGWLVRESSENGTGGAPAVKRYLYREDGKFVEVDHQE